MNISEKIKNKQNICIQCVGDSVTQGTMHCTDGETYTGYIASKLSPLLPHYKTVRYDGLFGTELGRLAGFEGPVPVSEGKNGAPVLSVVRNGVGGNTVRRAINRREDFTGTITPDALFPDLTTFMFGINDALVPDKSKLVSPERFYSDYCELIGLFRNSNPNSQIVLLTPSPNDWSVAEYVKQVFKVGDDLSIPVIDINAVWMERYVPGGYHFGFGELLSDDPHDACHPTPIGSELIAETVVKGILPLLGL